MAISRRDVMMSAAGAAALGVLPSAVRAAAGPDYIDMHLHLFSNEMSERLKLDCFDPVNLPKIVQFTISELDRAGASHAAFSVGNISLFKAPDTIGKVRRMNETFAKVVSDH